MMIDKIGSKQKKLGIYIHIPLCVSKCKYCDFYSVPSSDGNMACEYVDALCGEILSYRAPEGANCADGAGYAPADTVYFGGGTPTLLKPWQIEKILDSVRERFGIADGAEITCECNPKTADFNKLSEMRAIGVNRLSIGAQSARDGELAAIGRVHGFSDCKKTVSDARKAGFENISLDLMYGLPDQTSDGFLYSLDEIAALSPEHISSYCLKIEENTPFWRVKDSLALPDEDEICEMYLKMSERLSEYGYKKYEISNFSREGYESKHNLKYWNCEDYIGFGPSAHSFVGGVRYENARDIRAYISGEDIRQGFAVISDAEAANEYIMLGMRLACGISRRDFEARYGSFERYAEIFRKFVPEFVSEFEGGFAFTDRGMLVSNYILSEALDFE